jgi:hypothetical protein
MKHVAAAIVLVALAGCGRDHARRHDVVPQRDAETILESTAWLDSAPESETDVIHAWIFPRGEGLYFTGNAYKGAYETFRYFVEDERIKLRFQADGTKHEMRFRIERIDDRTFDYKLTLDPSPRGPSVYYGIDQGRRALPASIEAVISHIRH